MSNKKINDKTKLKPCLDYPSILKEQESVKGKLLKFNQAERSASDDYEINQVIHQLYDPVLDEKIPAYLLDKVTQKTDKKYLLGGGLLFVFLTGFFLGWKIKEVLV